MEGITLKLIPKENTTPVFPEIKKENVIQCKVTKAAVLEAGTVRGRTSIMLIGETEDGKHIVMETTARIIVNGIAPAAHGAASRWGDDLREP